MDSYISMILAGCRDLDKSLLLDSYDSILEYDSEIKNSYC